MDRVVKVGSSELVLEPGSAALMRRAAVSTEQLWAGITDVAPGVVSGWHHHGDYTTVFYVLAGHFTVEYAAGGAVESVDVGAGDFVVVPAGVPHNEIFQAGIPAEAVVIRYGKGGPTTTELEGPPGA